MNDIFQAIRLLYDGKVPEDPPSDYILHRFLASDQVYAQIASEFSLKIRDRKIMWELWRSVIPTGQKAPYFKYVAPKKPKEEKLVMAIKEREKVNTAQANEILTIFKLKNDMNSLMNYYGIEE